MNRRTFIGTITALAGLALAKLKAPAAPKIVKFTIPAPKISGDFLYFTQKHVYVRTKDGMYKWEPTSTQKHLFGFKPLK